MVFWVDTPLALTYAAPPSLPYSIIFSLFKEKEIVIVEEEAMAAITRVEWRPRQCEADAERDTMA